MTTPNLKTARNIYSADLSKSGSYLEVPVGNMIYRVEYTSSTELRLRIGASGYQSILADIKRSSQYDATGIEGNTQDNTVFTSSFVTIDNILYNRSNEIHITRIRQEDPETQLWSICDVHLFPSASGARTNVWLDWIATDLSY